MKLKKGFNIVVSFQNEVATKLPVATVIDSVGPSVRGPMFALRNRKIQVTWGPAACMIVIWRETEMSGLVLPGAPQAAPVFGAGGQRAH